MEKDLNLNVLRLIVAIADARSFSKAAKNLYISQPHLSQQVKSFEQSIGTAIFDRNQYPVKITPAGEIVVEWGRQIIADEAEVLKRVKAISDGYRSSIAIMASSIRSTIMLPQIIYRFNKMRPRCNISIKTASTISKRSEMLFNGEADILIDMMPYQVSDELYSEPIRRERLLLAVPKDHPILPNNAQDLIDLDLADLNGHKFISHLKHSKYNEMLYDACRKHGFIPDVAMEVPNVLAACAAVAEGIGIGLVPDIMQKNSFLSDKICYCNIRGFSEYQDVFVTYRRDAMEDENIKFFLKVLMDEN